VESGTSLPGSLNESNGLDIGGSGARFPPSLARAIRCEVNGLIGLDPQRPWTPVSTEQQAASKELSE